MKRSHNSKLKDIYCIHFNTEITTNRVTHSFFNRCKYSSRNPAHQPVWCLITFTFPDNPPNDKLRPTSRYCCKWLHSKVLAARSNTSWSCHVNGVWPRGHVTCGASRRGGWEHDHTRCNLSWCGLQHWEDGCASTTMLSNETTQNSDSFACWKSPLFPGTRALATWRDSFPNGGTLLTERDLRDFWANWRGGVRLVRFTTVDTGLVGGAARVTSETVNNSWRVFRSCHWSGSTRFLVEC